MIKLHEDEIPAFDVYFASICSFQYHPGAGAREHKALSIDECREAAMKMILARREIEIVR